MMHRESLRWLTLGSLAVCLACCGGAGAPLPEAPSPGRAELVGLDAATWSVAAPLCRRGLLPAWEALRRGGVRGNLETLDPTVSVVIWTTMATGQLPETHGIYNWTRGTPGELGGQLAITSNLRRSRAIWEVADSRDRSSLVVNWWASWPAERVRGGVISNRSLRGGPPGSTWPEELLRRVTELPRPAAWRVLNPLLASPPEVLVDGPVPFLADRLADDQVLAELSLRLRREQRPDLFAGYFRTLDLLQHDYWNLVQPEAFPAVPRAQEDLVEIIPRYYRHYDGYISRILEDAGAETTVMVASDHGMEPVLELPPAVEGLNLDGLLIRMGLLALSTPSKVDPEHTVARDARRLPPGLTRTLAVFPPSDEPEGQTLGRVRELLQGLETTGGSPLFTGIRPATHPGEHLELTLSPEIRPRDTLVVLGDAVPVRDLIDWIMHPRAGQHWHAPPGVILVAGERFRRGARLEGARVQDVAPTLLWAMDLPLARDLDGRLLEEAVRPAALERFPSRGIDSYGPRGEGTALPIGSAADEEVLEELRSLGYVN